MSDQKPAGASSPATSGAAPAKPAKKKNRALSITLATLATAAILFFVGRWFARSANLSQVWESIRTMPPEWAAALAASSVIYLLIFPLPYVAATIGLKYWPAFMMRQTAFTISMAVPGGGAIGLPVQYAMLSTFRITPQAAVTTVGIVSVGNLFMTLFMPVLGLVGLVIIGRVTASTIAGAAAGVAAVVVVSVLIGIILRSDSGAEKVGHLVTKLLAPVLRIIKKPPLDMSSRLVNFRNTVVGVLKVRWRWIIPAFFAVQFSWFAILYVAMRAVGGTVGLIETFAAFTFANLGLMVPLTPGGLGTTDAALKALLQLYGASSEVAVAADLVWRGVYYIPQVLLGVICFLLWQVVLARRSVKP